MNGEKRYYFFFENLRLLYNKNKENQKPKQEGTVAFLKFENSNDEAHAFCIIRNDNGEFMLYDQAMDNYGKLKGDPIKTLLEGNPLIIKEPFKSQGIYANACNLVKEKGDN